MLYHGILHMWLFLCTLSPILDTFALILGLSPFLCSYATRAEADIGYFTFANIRWLWKAKPTSLFSVNNCVAGLLPCYAKGWITRSNGCSLITPDVLRVPGYCDSNKACSLGFPHRIIAGRQLPYTSSIFPCFISVAKQRSVLLNWSVLTNYSHACHFSFSLACVLFSDD